MTGSGRVLTDGKRPSALLVLLAETYADDHRRPCCDADTALEDWLEAIPESRALIERKT